MVGSGRFSTKLEDHLQMTGSDILAAIRGSGREEGKPRLASARRIARREHFRLIYEMNPADQEINPNSVDLVEIALHGKFGADHVRRDAYILEIERIDFPIYTRDGRILSSLSMSKTLQRVPDFAIDCLYVNPASPERSRELVDRAPATDHVSGQKRGRRHR